MFRFDRHHFIYKLCEKITEMPEYNDETNDMGIDLEEIIPVLRSTSSGLTSALQLVDTTSNIKLISDSSDL